MCARAVLFQKVVLEVKITAGRKERRVGRTLGDHQGPSGTPSDLRHGCRNALVFFTHGLWGQQRCVKPSGPDAADPSVTPISACFAALRRFNASATTAKFITEANGKTAEMLPR